MSVEQLLERIRKEVKTATQEKYDAEGLLRLQETMAFYNGEYQLIWSDELLEELKNKPQVKNHVTGIEGLDSITGGFREQQLITISAHSKHGKTAFGLFLMGKLQETNPVMIPLEQSSEEIVEQRSSNNWSLPRFLSPRSLAARVTVDWIEERVVEGIAKYNTKLVLVDHLGYINDMSEEFRRENHAYRVEKVMQSLKNIAKKWNVIVVLLVHIVKADESKPPSLEDLKGSQSILGESDKVIMLWRKNEMKKKVRIYSNKTMVSVLANRRTGRNGNVGLEFNALTGEFEENNGWVEAMEKMATQEIEIEESFDALS